MPFVSQLPLDLAQRLEQPLGVLRRPRGDADVVVQSPVVEGAHEDAVAAQRLAPGGAVGAPQPAYLNQVCRLRTTLPATELMNRLLQIETKLGRNRKRKNESRPIDLDLLLYGDRVIDVPGLQVPHPRMPERAFVLAPLAEIAPELIHPLSGATPGDLLRDVDASGVRVWERGPPR